MTIVLYLLFFLKAAIYGVMSEQLRCNFLVHKNVLHSPDLSPFHCAKYEQDLLKDDNFQPVALQRCELVGQETDSNCRLINFREMIEKLKNAGLPGRQVKIPKETTGELQEYSLLVPNPRKELLN